MLRILQHTSSDGSPKWNKSKRLRYFSIFVGSGSKFANPTLKTPSFVFSPSAMFVAKTVSQQQNAVSILARGQGSSEWAFSPDSPHTAPLLQLCIKGSSKPTILPVWSQMARFAMTDTPASAAALWAFCSPPLRTSLSLRAHLQ